MLAQALAYSLFLAIPATALVVLGVFSLVADPSVIDNIVERGEIGRASCRERVLLGV